MPSSVRRRAQLCKSRRRKWRRGRWKRGGNGPLLRQREKTSREGLLGKREMAIERSCQRKGGALKGYRKRGEGRRAASKKVGSPQSKELLLPRTHKESIGEGFSAEGGSMLHQGEGREPGRYQRRKNSAKAFGLNKRIHRKENPLNREREKGFFPADRRGRKGRLFPGIFIFVRQKNEDSLQRGLTSKGGTERRSGRRKKRFTRTKRGEGPTAPLRRRRSPRRFPPLLKGEKWRERNFMSEKEGFILLQKRADPPAGWSGEG